MVPSDLGGLRLESFEIDGGAGNVELSLPEPSGTVSIRVEGGANNLSVRRPGGVATRLNVGRTGSETTLESGSFNKRKS
jgi:hypothetical protein